jgi:phage gp36-like protein
MTDQQLALHAISEAQLLLEEYLQPRYQNNEPILDKLVEVLERLDLVVAVSRLQQRPVSEVGK